MTFTGLRPRNGVTLMELVVVLAVLVAVAAVAAVLTSGAVFQAQGQATLETMTRVRDVILGPYRQHLKDDELFNFQTARGGSSAVTMRPLVLPRPPFTTVDTNGPPWGTSAPNRPNLKFLFTDPGFPTAAGGPATGRGWKGPYLTQNPANSGGLSFGVYHVNVATGFTTDFAAEEDFAVMDAWGRPVVLVEEVSPVAPSAANRYRLRARLVSAGPDGKLNDATDNIELVVEDREEPNS